MDRICEALKQGYIKVRGPYGAESCVSLSPRHVKAITWWSKNYQKWIHLYQTQPDLLTPFKNIFNFTLIGHPTLETGLQVTREQRLEQLATLVSWFSPRAIKLRFDPITVWTDPKTHQRLDNTEFYPEIIQRASQLGIRLVIFAFCLNYPKVVARMKRKGTPLVTLTREEEKTILDRLIDIAETFQIQLQTCCGSQWIGYRGITKSSCVDGRLIEEIYGIHLKTTHKDSGQRKECGCTASKDIGSYDWSCPHDCAYCYASK
jgi:hypothetical protein